MLLNLYEGVLGRCFLLICVLMIAVSSSLLLSVPAFGQADQGAITGTVLDPQGGVIANADMKLTNLDTGFTATAKTDQSGTYVFSPVKIGRYSVTCSAPGFKTEIQADLTLHVNERLGANFHLQIGQVTETVRISDSDRPILQTEDSSTGQVISSKVINETPLNQRNYVFIAHLVAGVAPTPGGKSRGQGNGDFSANGQRPDQNDFILDGVDNNSSAIDFLNGASYVIKPPPDALAEFKLQTGSYSAELGHSAGAVVNASIKSGTKSLHGDLWEYFRNDYLDAKSFNDAPGPKPEYRQNQFGATIGGPVPILKNHLFFFGDFEANRIIIGNTGTFTVPTALMRTGDFSELLNPALSGGVTTLYQPGSGGSQLLMCNGKQNVFCPNQINAVAQNILNQFPAPNFNGGKTSGNYKTNLNRKDNTAQWDGRLDWNINDHDQAFARVSYSNDQIFSAVPFGILDGGGYGSDGPTRLFSQQLALSETHVFTPSLSNEFRFSFLYGSFLYGFQNLNKNVSAQLGLGGVPTAAGGGLPWLSVGGIGDFGTTCCLPAVEHQNNLEILDNVSKIAGKHALKMGIQLLKVRSNFYISGFPRGWYRYNGLFTSNPGVSNGYGVADFLADLQNENHLTTANSVDQFRWYRAAYVQDDWKITPRLTLNLGLRWDHYNPFSERLDRQGNLVITSAGLGTGIAQYQVPVGAPAVFGPTFTSLAAKDNISIVSSSNRSLADAQMTNFAPRIGFAYAVTPKTVVRAAFGIFYGGLQNGFGTNIGANYPFTIQSNYFAPTCPPGGPCTGTGIKLATGFSAQIANGLGNLPVVLPSLNMIQPKVKTPYTKNYNLTVQRALTSSMTASIGYVGATSRNLQQNAILPNLPFALARPGTNMQPYTPFPDFGQITETAFIAYGNYNSLQATLEKHFSNGLNFLAAYTYSHTLDDEAGLFGFAQNINLVPLSNQYGNSDQDVRQRFALNGNYQLPVGAGRRFLNRKGILDALVGGWAIGAVFVAQTGNPVTVFGNNFGSVPAGGDFGCCAPAHLTRDPFQGGGSPDPTNPNITCPAKVKTVQNWFNPCAFANPLSGSNIAPGQLITSTALAIQYLGSGKNQIHGPGYNRLNTSMFKRFSTREGQYLEFRADIFNVYNSPAYVLPGFQTIFGNAGQIFGPRSLGANSPDGRFVQVALKYVF